MGSNPTSRPTLEKVAHNGLAGRGQIRRVSHSFDAAPGGLCALEEVRLALYGTLKRLPSMALTREKAQLMSASEIDRTLVRLAHEVLERTQDLDRLVFIGIRRRGVPLAQRLSKKIESLEQRKIPVGILDITLYRDDLSTVSPQPVINSTDIPFPVVAKDVILMDDVLYTGRTIRSALDALFDHGRPARVQLLVLIDRGHRELPIEAQYVGRMVQTTDQEIIEVKFQEIDGVEKVLLVEKTAEGA
ncbi:MAG TPA: bifunctional pyr operon transcriptional regulator/uracil phosphoribosyltransferase PyrR [Bryobacteraceae bacterium]